MFKDLKVLQLLLIFTFSTLIIACSDNAKGNMIDDQEVVEIAKKQDSNSALNWNAVFEYFGSIEPSFR